MDRLLPTMNIGVPEGERGREGEGRVRDRRRREERGGGREEKIGEGKLNPTINHCEK